MYQKLRAVVLAAGHGKRMKSATPKVLHPVLGKPILGRLLSTLDKLALEHIHIVLGHQADQIESYLKENPPQTPWSIHLQNPQLGTGHALMQACNQLSTFRGHLLVVPGDTPLITVETLAGLINVHQSDSRTISMLTTVVDDPKNYGRILRGAAEKIIGIVEDKDATPAQKKILEVNPSIYCFAWPDIASGLAAIKNINQQKEYYLTDLIGWAASNGLDIGSSKCPDWKEVGGINTRVDLAEVIGHLRDRVVCELALNSGVTIVDPANVWIAPEVSIGMDSTIAPGCQITGEVTIGDDCQIGPNSIIYGPVKIGHHCRVVSSHISNCAIGSHTTIGPFAHLRDGVVIGDSVRIGNFVEVKSSGVGDHSNAAHLSYIGDATVGSQVNIAAGTIVANYNSITKVKSRTVIGDSAATGCNSVLVSPVEIGNGAFIAAGSVISKDVPADALAVGRARQAVKEGWAKLQRQKASNPSTNQHA